VIGYDEIILVFIALERPCDKVGKVPVPEKIGKEKYQRKSQQNDRKDKPPVFGGPYLFGLCNLFFYCLLFSDVSFIRKLSIIDFRHTHNL